MYDEGKVLIVMWFENVMFMIWEENYFKYAPVIIISYYRVILLGLSHKIAVCSCYKLINSVKYLREAHSVVAFGALYGHVITH